MTQREFLPILIFLILFSTFSFGEIQIKEQTIREVFTPHGVGYSGLDQAYQSQFLEKYWLWKKDHQNLLPGLTHDQFFRFTRGLHESIKQWAASQPEFEAKLKNFESVIAAKLYQEILDQPPLGEVRLQIEALAQMNLSKDVHKPNIQIENELRAEFSKTYRDFDTNFRSYESLFKRKLFAALAFSITKQKIDQPLSVDQVLQNVRRLYLKEILKLSHNQIELVDATSGNLLDFNLNELKRFTLLPFEHRQEIQGSASPLILQNFNRQYVIKLNSKILNENDLRALSETIKNPNKIEFDGFDISQLYSPIFILSHFEVLLLHLKSATLNKSQFSKSQFATTLAQSVVQDILDSTEGHELHLLNHDSSKNRRATDWSIPFQKDALEYFRSSPQNKSHARYEATSEDIKGLSLNMKLPNRSRSQAEADKKILFASIFENSKGPRWDFLLTPEPTKQTLSTIPQISAPMGVATQIRFLNVAIQLNKHDQTIGVPTPPGLKAINWQFSNSPPELEIVQNQTTKEVYIQLVKGFDSFDGAITFQIQLIPDDPPENQDLLTLSKQKVIKVIRELQQLGFSALADQLEWLQIQDQLNLEKIVGAIQTTSKYSYLATPQEVENKNSLSDLKVYLNEEGETCFQCRDSSKLLSLILNAVVNKKPGVEIRQVVGFQYEWGSGQITMAQAHSKVAIFLKGRFLRTLDCTPYLPDERSLKTQRSDILLKTYTEIIASKSVEQFFKKQQNGDHPLLALLNLSHLIMELQNQRVSLTDFKKRISNLPNFRILGHQLEIMPIHPSLTQFIKYQNQVIEAAQHNTNNDIALLTAAKLLAETLSLHLTEIPKELFLDDCQKALSRP